MIRNNLELVEGVENSESSIGAKVGGIKGNPVFKDQFNFRFKILYESAGLLVDPSALPPVLQVPLPVFLFGNSDFAGGFNKARSYFPINSWVPNPANAYGIQGKETDAIPTAIFAPFIKTGDLYFAFNTIAGVPVHTAVIIVNCPQVAYGSLLDSLNSDVLNINMIRYIVDPANENQFSNQILIIAKSIFGKTTDDKFDPGTFVTGKTFNMNIADIPINMEINRTKAICFYIEHDCVNFSWSITVSDTKKITL
jgi:hypothetical protein